MSAATYKDVPSSRNSGSLEDVEMQERESSDYRGDQEQRLLPGTPDIGTDLESEGDAGLTYKVEYHLRTGWAIFASVLVSVLVFAALVIFARFYIAKGLPQYDIATSSTTGTTGGGSISGFRRPSSEYVLDPAWDFHASPKVRKYNWNITDIVGNPDGVYRPLLTINGLFPGPLIECNEGDTLIIDVENHSVNSTSIHFHGLFQNGTNWMDGATGVTQCPIAPGRKFTYKFKISGQAGTYFYHGHQAVQSSDGLFGPLVVHSTSEKQLQRIPYVSDRVVIVQDYYHDLSSGLLRTSLEPGNEGAPIPDGALINGENVRDCSTIDGQRLCDNSTAAQPAFDLQVNANHRLRFINVAALAWFQVSLDEHDFAITEADGTDILPAFDTRLMIGPAQRYSLVVNTKHETKDAFWLRARMISHCWNEPELPGPGANEVRAIIQYSQSTNPKSEKQPLVIPTSEDSGKGIEVECRDMNTTSYVPAISQPPPPVADHSYYLRSNIEIGDWRLERGFFNTSTFRPNLKSPTLHRTIEGLSTQNKTFQSNLAKDGVNSECYDLKNDFLIQHTGIKTVDLVIQNFDEGNHPMHLHGHKFWILGQGHGMFPGYASLGLQRDGKGLLPGRERALEALLRRDVASVEGFGWLVLRFVADNPGVWAFHCHMAWHSEAGLAMQFLSRVDEVATWVVPEENKRLCEAKVEDLEKGAAPKDSIWFGFGIGR